MISAPSTADVYTDFQGLSQLRVEARKQTPESLRQAAGQFEALFIQMMLKSMRDAGLGEGLMDSEQVKTYQSMFDQQLAIDLSKRNSLGLADMLVRQLSRAGDVKAEVDADVVAAPLHPLPATPFYPQQRLPADTAPVDTQARRQPPALGSASKDDWQPDSPEAFVRELWPHAQRAADALGTRPDVLLAQAALETGWGKHMMRGPDGVNSFNLFGIKADARWQGERVLTETVEYRDGIVSRERATFRAYDSLADSFADYVQFLRANPRYQRALEQAADAPAFARALSEAGYATDPDYSGKINRIMDSPQLRDAVTNVHTAADESVSG